VSRIKSDAELVMHARLAWVGGGRESMVPVVEALIPLIEARVRAVLAQERAES
jgi:hypothetical protein